MLLDFTFFNVTYSLRELLLMLLCFVLLFVIFFLNKGLKKSSELINQLTKENRLYKCGGVIDEEKALY